MVSDPHGVSCAVVEGETKSYARAPTVKDRPRDWPSRSICHRMEEFTCARVGGWQDGPGCRRKGHYGLRGGARKWAGFSPPSRVEDLFPFLFFSLFFSLFFFNFKFSFLLLDFKFKCEFQLWICTYIKCAKLNLVWREYSYVCIYFLCFMWYFFSFSTSKF
jgi:hypothetical protein